MNWSEAISDGGRTDVRLSRKDEPPPSRTPGQAEGEEDDLDRTRPEHDPLRRRKPSQAEGDDADDEADEVPKDDD